MLKAELARLHPAVNAIQFTKARADGVALFDRTREDMPQWVKDALAGEPGQPGSLWVEPDASTLTMLTASGEASEAQPGDFIICDDNGFRRCSAEYFEVHYRRA